MIIHRFIIIDQESRLRLQSSPCPPSHSHPARPLRRGGGAAAPAHLQRELEPGSWIDELKLAEEYGISRTPLREALKVLAAEGLVTMKVRRGAYVTEVSDTRPGGRLPPALAAGKRRRRRGRQKATRRRAEGTCRRCTPNWKRAGRATATQLLRHQRALPHAPAGDRRQPLAQPDGGRPAQGDEAQSPQLAAEVGAHRGIAARSTARSWTALAARDAQPRASACSGISAMAEAAA